MDVCIDVDPVRTLLVLGPQITAQCLSENRESTAHPSFLEYRSIVEKGIKKSLELDNLTTNEAIRRKEMLLLNAYELEPSFAANKVMETLKEHNEYASWMKEMSLNSKDYQFDGNQSPTLQYILSLRREGARLIYTHYDDLMARALGLPVVLMEDDESARKWSQGFPALLHVHGVFSRPQSLKMDCLCYKTQVGEGKSADIVREQFQSRAVIFLGFDEPFIDPLLPKMLSTFAGPSTMPSSFPLLLSCCVSNTVPVSGGCLMLKMQKLDLNLVLKVSSKSLGVAPMNDAGHPVSVRLTSTDSQSTQDIIDVLSHHPNIMARVNEDGLILNLQMSRPSLQRMWSEVFMFSLFSRSCGLIAIHMEGSLVVRVRDATFKNSAPAYNPSSGQLRIASPMNSSLWKPTVSTATPISSISQITALPQLTVPTSLIGNVQQHLINAHLSRDKPSIQHDKVKRIRSENDGLIFRERQEAKRKRSNGLLTHQQSAPLFPYITSQGGFIQAGGPQINIRPPVFAVPSVPPILLNMEQKQEERSAAITIEIPEQEVDANKVKKSEQKEEKNFENKKSKFIREARQWSKHLEEKLFIKPEQDPTSPSRYLNHENKISINQTMFTPPSTSPQLTPYSSHLNPSNSPILANQKQPPTYLMGTSQSGGMYTILPHSPTLSTGMLSNQVPILATAVQTLQQTTPNKSPKDGNNRVLSAITTPTLNPDQKFVYMLQDGTLIATPIIQERQLGGVSEVTKSEYSPFKSPKRISSPNSDSDIMTYPQRKRRRSSSLPVSNLKSPSSSSGSSHSTPPPNTLFPIPSPTEIKTEARLLSFPQITSPSTGHYNTNVFFSGMQMTPATEHYVMKMEGDLTNDEKCHADNEIVQPQSPDNQLHPVPVGRGPIQLWQFLLDLLISPDKSHMIQWTGNGYEFRIVQPEEIAKLWGARKNKPRMNYDKLSRGLRYYYSKGIMDKVPGKKLTFKYTCNIQQYMSQRSANSSESTQIAAVSNNSL